jgi:hypothetical protein
MTDILTEAPIEDANLTPGQIISEMILIRAEKTKLKDQEKALNEIWRALETQLLAHGDALGMKRMAGDDGTATITEDTLPQVEDWDAVHQYIIDNQACHLLQRRVSTAVFREMQAAGMEVPGLRPYIQKKINLRKK